LHGKQAVRKYRNVDYDLLMVIASVLLAVEVVRGVMICAVLAGLWPWTVGPPSGFGFGLISNLAITAVFLVLACLPRLRLRDRMFFLLMFAASTVESLGPRLHGNRPAPVFACQLLMIALYAVACLHVRRLRLVERRRKEQ
jgi:hypothetical protein